MIEPLPGWLGGYPMGMPIGDRVIQAVGHAFAGRRRGGAHHGQRRKALIRSRRKRKIEKATKRAQRSPK